MPRGTESKKKRSRGRELGSPSRDAAKVFGASIVGVVPVVGPIISSALAAAIEAENTRNLNALVRSIEEEIARSKVTVEELLEDSVFRGGISQLYLSIIKQEPKSKLDRVRNFVRHRIQSPRKSNIVSEAVLRTFEVLPASHIEEFLRLVAKNDLDLYDFSIILGEHRFDVSQLVRDSVSAQEAQDYCGSPADVRQTELYALFGSLSNAGLVRLVEPLTKSGPSRGPIYETTDLAKAFIGYCLDPGLDYEERLRGKNPA